MINKKQIIVVVSVILLMAVLLSLDIKGLVKPKEQPGTANAATTEAAAVSNVSLEQVSATAKEDLNANLAKQVSDLENSLKSASESEKPALHKKLGELWNDVNKPAPAAFYYEFIAGKESNYENWLKTGDLFTDAYQNTSDSLSQPALVQKAITAYQKALEINAKSLDARTGLGIAYVSGTPNPMQGIQLLLEVVKEDPQNIKANMNLGLFSMKSGQFDKAVNRFKTVVAQKPDPEAWFYLASSYENQGLKEDAIMAYLKSKELAADPSLGQFVDRKIKELKQ
ncbi:tetratricopeptide repeat protein [Daejeonella oryzae]|uniref:tetratricopeptide repeat protein n=1 Tax=Daejeonella oryzae TaxID=1122943 RepID=UPI0004278B17|nr:tetratricopeptide repeat protein [Daejeonella oryzae]